MPTARFQRLALASGAVLVAAVCSPASLGRTLSEPPVAAPADTTMTLAEAIRLYTALNVVMSPEQAATASKVINEAQAAHGTETSWRYGRAMVLRAGGARVEARELMEQVIKAEPNVADHQFWYGTLCFETINSAGLFEKMGLGNKGKAAYDEALKLDASHVSARLGLFQYYANAPSIAGGSKSKAKALCDELLALPDGKGEYTGQVLLGQLAATNEDWAEMANRYTLAETARGEGAGLVPAIRAHARSLLNAKKDPAAALAMIERALPLAASNDAQVWFIKGQAHQQLKQPDEAAAAYGRAVEINPTGAPSSLWGLAECLEASGKFKDAAKRYAEFARLFPKDDRADKAGDKAKACEKQAR